MKINLQTLRAKRKNYNKHSISKNKVMPPILSTVIPFNWGYKRLYCQKCTYELGGESERECERLFWRGLFSEVASEERRLLELSEGLEEYSPAYFSITGLASNRVKQISKYRVRYTLFAGRKEKHE